MTYWYNRLVLDNERECRWQSMVGGLVGWSPQPQNKSLPPRRCMFSTTALSLFSPSWHRSKAPSGDYALPWWVVFGVGGLGWGEGCGGLAYFINYRTRNSVMGQKIILSLSLFFPVIIFFSFYHSRGKDRARCGDNRRGIDMAPALDSDVRKLSKHTNGGQWANFRDGLILWSHDRKHTMPFPPLVIITLSFSSWKCLLFIFRTVKNHRHGLRHARTILNIGVFVL